MDVEQGTNCADVLIVAFICLTFWVLARITKKTILGWKDKEINANKPAENNQPNSNSQVNDLKLAEKLLDFLKSQTKNYGEKGEFKSYKPIDSSECKIYNDVLACLIEAQQKEDKKIDIEKLKKALHVSDSPK